MTEAVWTNARAPGRVNLIGEHTDYNGGFVLPMALPYQTEVRLRRTGGTEVRGRSQNLSQEGQHRYELGQEKPQRAWFAYLEGTTWLLRREGFTLSGFECEIDSRVPIGSGLSSSAALLVALLRALRQGFELKLTDVEVALLAQKVENEFVGARVGIMDPYAASLGAPGFALFIDTRSLESRRVELPADRFSFLAIHSGVSHSNAFGGGYNERRAECEEAARILGVPLLRDVSLADLPAAQARLPDRLFRRVRHVVTEDARVLEAVRAFETGNAVRAGELFKASHESLHSDYEVTVPALDQLVAAACAEPEVYGARMTGGGFGGSVVILARPGNPELPDKIMRRYEKESGHVPQLLLPKRV